MFVSFGKTSPLITMVIMHSLALYGASQRRPPQGIVLTKEFKTIAKALHVRYICIIVHRFPVLSARHQREVIISLAL